MTFIENATHGAADVATRPKALYLPLALFSAIGFVFVNLGAQVYLVEILAIFVCIHAFLSRSQTIIPTIITSTLLLWLFGTIASDAVNSTALGDSIKGIARAVMLLILLFALSHATRGFANRILSMWIGITASLLLSIALLPNGYFAGEPWKFGFGLPVTLIAFLLAATWLRPAGILVALTMGAVNFVMGSRSTAIVCMIAALVLIVRSRSALRSGTTRLIFVLVTGLTLIVLVVTLYDQLAMSGAFGEARRLRADYQSSGNLGILATGRGEIFFSIRTILDNPAFGVGSYAPPPTAVLDDQVSFLQAEGYASVATNYLNDGLRSFHSEIFGAIAENGLLAAPFWIAVGGYLTFGLFSVLRGTSKYPELVAFLSAYGLWDLFFSPFGADRRYWVAATLVSILVLCARKASHEGLNRDDQLQSGGISREEPSQH